VTGEVQHSVGHCAQRLNDFITLRTFPGFDVKTSARFKAARNGIGFGLSSFEFDERADGVSDHERVPFDNGSHRFPEL
jgi:hypothetical protein